MRTLFTVCIFMIASAAYAQKLCVTSDYTEQQKSFDPSVTNRMTEIERFIIQQKTFNSFNTRTARTGGGDAVSLIKIPVVVHILYKSQDQNISEAQIKSQIDALNRDFRRMNSDTVNTPDRFKAVSADVEIQFELATTDPQGRATSGIVRKQTSVSEWKMDDKIKFSAQGGDNAWDSRYYLNIWVGNMRSLLGYSTIPGSPAEKDGLVINSTAFGTINVASAYNMGRTAVHEIGHWLGLKHIWGDTYCGDDLVDDTPKQGNFTPGCPNTFRSSCNNGTTGDMYMNYMDFTNDACLNLFTLGQKERMRTMFNTGGPRNSILSSKGLAQPWNYEPPVAESPLPEASRFTMFPNPATSEMILNFEYNPKWIGKTISIINLNGIIISKVQITSKSQKLNLNLLKPGMYFIQGENEGEKIREKLVKL